MKHFLKVHLWHEEFNRTRRPATFKLMCGPVWVHTDAEGNTFHSRVVGEDRIDEVTCRRCLQIRDYHEARERRSIDESIKGDRSGESSSDPLGIVEVID